MGFKAHFLNVGCADCTIFEMDNDLVVIDCGYRRFGNRISKPTDIGYYIKNVIGKNYIDLLIITHPHHDHYLGMQDLIGKFTIAEFWGSPYERRYGDNSLSLDDWKEYCHLKEKLIPDNQKRFVCSKGVRITFDSCEFLVLGLRKEVNQNDTRECHDASLVIWISTPANKFIVCGDASDSELDQIRADWKLSKCDILRASHHGSERGANLEFIKVVSPRDTIVSTKSGVFENLPSQKALQRYRHYSSNVFRTDIDQTCTAPLKL